MVTCSSGTYTTNFAIPSLGAVATYAVFVGASNPCWDGRYDQEGAFDNIVLEGLNQPLIIVQPQSSANVIGSSAVLTVTATGTPTLQYQWYKDCMMISNSTVQSLLLTNVHQSDVGYYYVVVSNSFGVVTSQVATLTVAGSLTGC
jgi:hypothetical protein